MENETTSADDSRGDNISLTREYERLKKRFPNGIPIDKHEFVLEDENAAQGVYTNRDVEASKQITTLHVETLKENPALLRNYDLIMKSLKEKEMIGKTKFRSFIVASIFVLHAKPFKNIQKFFDYVNGHAFQFGSDGKLTRKELPPHEKQNIFVKFEIPGEIWTILYDSE